MSLELLLQSLGDLAIRYNLVNYSAAGPSIYMLNPRTIDSYPILFISPTDDIRIGKNITTYGLTLYYLERLLADSENETQIFSNAVLTLSNFLRQVKSLDGIVDVGDYSVRLFTETEKMADRVAGGYARVEISVLNTLNCSIWFDETGAPMGTYIPASIKDVSVLDALASKEWVVKYVDEQGAGGGISEDEARRLINQELKSYTKTEKFATINGSGITSNEEYDLLEKSTFNGFLSGYTQDKEAIYAAISAASPDNYEKVCEQVSANTENISELSAFTSGLSFTIAEQSQMIEQISAATTGTSEEISDLSGYTQQAVSSLTEDIETLSALTTQTSDDLADLSGFTGQAVSSLTDDLQALSAATESGFTAISQDLDGKQDALTAGSGITITNNVISTRANVHSETVFEIVSLTEAQYEALVVKDPNTLYIITE